MANLMLKVEMYQKLRDMKREDAMVQVLHESQEQITHMDQKLAECMSVMTPEDIKRIFPIE